MSHAEDRIQNINQRPTPVRRAVLGVLLDSSDPLAHIEVLERLQSIGQFDRVTVYRVLDWLVAHGLAHKVAGAGRAWRFQATHSETMHHHAHFQCTQCGKVFCLPEVLPTLPKQVPANFTVESVELNLKGICADCGAKIKHLSCQG